MAFTYTNSRGQSYILHSKDTVLKNGHTRTIYFFAKDQRDSALNEVPEGYQVVESKNGLPVLKRIK
jgi:hypothetical protein